MARIIKVYLLSHVLTVISLAEDWGAYPFEDFTIIDFNHERETWTLKDGGARSLKSFSVLPTPKVLETKFGKRITISRLGYDSSLNEFILSLESDGKKFDLSLKEADLHLNQESTQRLNEYLVQIDDTKQIGGKRYTGILMEISPDFSQLALATGSRQFEANAIRHETRPNLPPLMIPYKRKIVLRKVIHCKIAQISPDSQKRAPAQVNTKPSSSVVIVSARIISDRPIRLIEFPPTNQAIRCPGLVDVDHHHSRLHSAEIVAHDHADEMVGKLLVALGRLKLRENTLVLFTGDNGTAVRSKLRHFGKSGKKYEYEKVVVRQNGRNVPGGKGLLNDRGTHVPLIVNWPGKITPETTCLDLVDFSDWLPTVAEIGRAELPKDVKFDGQSFASSFLAKNESARTFAFSESKGGQAFVRDQRYKLYANGKFYDVSIDPEERKPLAKGKVTEARKRLETAFRDIGYGK